MKKIMTLCGLLLLGGAFTCLSFHTAHADTVYGPFHLTGEMVAPYGIHEYTFSCWGNEITGVLADANGDVDIHVCDSAGNLVASNDGLDWMPFCQWIPPYRQVYTLQVINRENYPVQFDLDTN